VFVASSSSECMMPALLNSTWSLPYSDSAKSIIALQSSALVTSAWKAVALPSARSTMTTVWRAVFSSRSTATTSAPSVAKRMALSRPMPLPAPVISATFPSNRPMCPPVVRFPPP